jgi:hypothetical protein
MDRKTRRFVTAAVIVAASCNVYDPSLLVGGGGSGSGASGGSAATSGKSGSAGSGGSGGSTGGSMNGGTGGASGSAGASGGKSGSSNAGGSAGKGGSGGSGGSSGVEQTGGDGGDPGGEAGMSSSGGTGGTGGTGGGGKGGTAGTGGSAGTGGGGKGGTGGAGAGGAGASGAGAGGAGMGGTGGAATATGCAKLTTALNESTDVAHFVITMASATDLTGKTVTVRTYVQAGSGGSIRLYVQSGPSASPAYGWNFSAQTALSGTGTWKDLTYSPPSGTATSGAVRLGIEVTAAPATSGWTASTIVFVDSVTVNTTTPISYTFDATGTVYTTQTTADQVDKIWINNSDADTPSQTRTGTSVAWAATCP